MRKILSASPLALCVLGALALYGCSANGPAGLTGSLPADQAPAPQTQHANGVVEDWSTSHVIYPRVGSMSTMMALQSDVRANQSWQLAARNALLRSRVPRRFLPIASDAHRDWSISLGTGSVAPSMYPAKFSFDVSSTALTAANCTSDFVVYPINVAGSGTQPNIAAFDNLYTGTAPSAGICNRAITGSDLGTTEPTVLWGYNVTAAGGVVATSPALSLDGTRVAFVETGSGTTAHFHVLAWKSGDGVNAGNLQSVASPATPGAAAGAPAAGSGTVTDLALNIGTTKTDSLSSPFVDYGQDTAYVGNDSGELFRIKNVFCTSPGCTTNGSPAPSLDTSWGGTGAISVCTGVLSGAVVDGSNGNVFVGCSDGKLYGFTRTGTALTTPSVTVGNGTADGGVVDPPLVDASNHLVYAVAGASGGGTEVVVQASSVDLSGASTASLGAGGQFNLHAPAVNSAYLSGGPGAAGALLYEWGLNAGGTAIELYGIGFTGSTMDTTPTNSLGLTGTIAVEFSPVTEFENSPNDLLFVSGLVSVTSPAFDFIEYNINSFPTADPPSGGAGSTGATFATAGPGTSGIIVDNASGSAQASSIYYGDLGTAHNAVKLTQGDLQ